jgi:hypothetical protein
MGVPVVFFVGSGGRNFFAFYPCSHRVPYVFP